jgi:hypothetical protein
MEKNIENPVFEKRNQAKLWLVILFVGGVCIFSLCVASGGLILWQSQLSRAEAETPLPPARAGRAWFCPQLPLPLTPSFG